jgi:hypothetical protein
MVMVRATKESETGKLPSRKLLEEMGKFNQELIEAGVFQDAAGLKASSHGKRVKFAGAKPVVMDGPFAETRELIGGFWLWKVSSVDEAVEWLKKSPFVDAEIEIRPLLEPEDFAGVE